jgi:iron(III) transport system substrate-binding protein
MFSRRGVLQAAAGLAGTLAARRHAFADDMTPAERDLYATAAKEGELTWYTGQMQAEPSEAVGRAFTARFPGVKVNVVRSTSQVAFQRLSQDMAAGVAQCDVFSSTDYSHYAGLKADGKLAKYRPEGADHLLEPFRHPDKDDMYQVIYLGLYQIAFNTKKVSAADAPKTWKDLLDPKWRGQTAIGHPGYSGAIGLLCIQLSDLYGWDYFKALEKNKPQIGRSSNDPVTLLNAGERSIGIAIPQASVLLSQARGNPLELVYPTEGVLGVAALSGVMKNAPHPSAARLFTSFATSTLYGETLRPFYEFPLRSEVAPPPGARPIDQMKLITPTIDEAVEKIDDMKDRWRDVFGI